MFFYVIILGLPLAHVLWWWASVRANRGCEGRTPRVWAYHAVAALLLGSYVWALAARFIGAENGPPLLLLAATYVWFLTILPWGAPLAAIAAIVAGRPERRSTEKAGADGATEPHADTAMAVRPSRRELIAGGLAAIPPLAAAASIGIAVPRLTSFRVRRIEIALAALPADLDGLTIAHLSDSHAGRFADERMLRAIADETNRLRPDFALFTGDLIDFSLDYLPAGIDMLRRIQPLHGRFVCEGNHDLFDDRSAFEKRMSSAGVGLLLGEAETVRVRGADVQFLGTRWAGRVRGVEARQDRLGEALALKAGGAFPILLAHHPHDFDRAADAGIPLTLAGHTHGGQLMLTDAIGAGPALFRYWSGLYRRDDAALVVSNGVGNWFPLRINAPAEIIHITLRRDPHQNPPRQAAG